jgi:hypothetical protein
VTILIWKWSLGFLTRNFTSSMTLEFWVKIPWTKKKFSLPILTSLRMKFEQCVLNLIWKWITKDPIKKEDHLISWILEWRSSLLKWPPKRKLWCNFEHYSFFNPMKQGALIFWDWFTGKCMKILQLLCQIFVLWFFDNMISLAMLKVA